MVSQHPRPRTHSRCLLPALAILVAVIWPVAAQEDASPEALSRTGARLAARVNGEEITFGQLSTAVNQYVFANRLGPDSGIAISEIQRTVLDRLIATELVNQRARALELAASPEEVEERLEAMRSEVGSPEDFRLMLTVRNLTESLLREQLGQQIAAEKVIDAEVFANMEISDEEVRSYYEEHREELTTEEQVHVRHIVVRLRPDMTEEERSAAREKIDSVKTRLDAGEDFEDLAVERSEDSAAASGGDLGWLARSEVGGPFQVVAFSLSEGEVSEVVATDHGYHIIEVLGRKPEAIMPLAEARPMILERLRDQRLPAAVRGYIAGLRESAEVETFLPSGG